jgi:zinc protease
MVSVRTTLIFCVLAMAFPARANPFAFDLPNGLRLIVKEDHRAPSVVQQVWYRVGSMDEVPGTTGVAHVLEHMMFKGTKRVAPEEFSRIIAEAGGRENAFTSTDYTVYFEQVHRDSLPLAMKLEADRMANLVILPEEFAREIKVVMEERRWRTEDAPRSLLEESLMSTAFSAHPYKSPVIGWMQDLQEMSWQDALAWYKRWYAPDNAVVVVVGDVDGKHALDLAKRYYGPLSKRPLPHRKIIEEPTQRGIKHVVVKAPAELPFVRFLYKVPVLRDTTKDWEPFALSLLAQLLGGDDAARLNQILVRDRRVATTASTEYEMVSRGPGMFLVEAAAAQGRSGDEIESAVRDAVRRVSTEGVSAEELQRAKVQRLAEIVYRRDSIFAEALEIGQLETSGLAFEDADRIPRGLKAITTDQIRAVAAKYLIDDNLTVAALDPQPLNPGRVTGAAPVFRH